MATLETIEARYNAEHDMIKDGPDVTWAEMVLAEAAQRLDTLMNQKHVEVARLQDDVAALKREAVRWRKYLPMEVLDSQRQYKVSSLVVILKCLQEDYEYISHRDLMAKLDLLD